MTFRSEVEELKAKLEKWQPVLSKSPDKDIQAIGNELQDYLKYKWRDKVGDPLTQMIKYFERS